jgi:hypothetical protein
MAAVAHQLAAELARLARRSSSVALMMRVSATESGHIFCTSATLSAIEASTSCLMVCAAVLHLFLHIAQLFHLDFARDFGLDFVQIALGAAIQRPAMRATWAAFPDR